MSSRKWGINNDPVRGSYIDALECLVCERLHENQALKKFNQPTKRHQATEDHYGCPLEKTFSTSGEIIDENYSGPDAEYRENSFKFSYELGKYLQEAFFEYFLPNGIYEFTAKKLQSKAMKLYQRKEAEL